MEQRIQSTILISVALMVGLAIGSAIARPTPPVQQRVPAAHVMPDGSMMNGRTASMTEMMQSMDAGLRDKIGDAFDAEFLDEMIVHHEGAVAMARQVLEKSHRPELQKLANDIIMAQTAEIGMMKGWRAEWFAK